MVASRAEGNVLLTLVVITYGALKTDAADARAESAVNSQQRRQAGDVIDRHRGDGGREIRFLRIGVNRAETLLW